MVALAIASTPRVDNTAAPWSQVSARIEDRGNTLEEGNAQFLEHHADALDAAGAPSEWDHPAIHFNIVRCLHPADRAAEASENPRNALKYARRRSKMLSTPRRSPPEATANQTRAGGLVHAPAIVTADGQPIGACPGKQVRRVAVGRHQIVGAQQGFLTRTLDIVVAGGAREHTDMALLPLSETARVVHRWPAWIPWVVFGGGLAVVGAGALVEGIASSKISDFDRALVRDCSGPGCGPGRRSDADLQIESSPPVRRDRRHRDHHRHRRHRRRRRVPTNRGRTVHGYEQVPVEVTNVAAAR